MIDGCGVLTHAFVPAHSLSAAIAAARKGDAVAWIAASDPTSEDLDVIGQAVGADPDALAGARELRRTLRIDRFSAVVHPQGVVDIRLLGFRRAGNGDFIKRGELQVLCGESVVAVLGKDWHEPITDVLSTVLPGLPALEPLSSIGVVGLVLGHVFEGYNGLLDELEDVVDELSVEILSHRDPSHLRSLIQLSRPTYAAVITVEPFLHALEGLRLSGQGQALAQFGRRILAEVTYLVARVERIDRSISALQQTYVSLAQDEANRISLQQGEIAKRLAAWAVLITMPAGIFTLFGTNFQNIPLTGLEWGYPILLLLVASACLLVYRGFRRSGWL